MITSKSRISQEDNKDKTNTFALKMYTWSCLPDWTLLLAFFRGKNQQKLMCESHCKDTLFQKSNLSSRPTLFIKKREWNPELSWKSSKILSAPLLTQFGLLTVPLSSLPYPCHYLLKVILWHCRQKGVLRDKRKRVTSPTQATKTRNGFATPKFCSHFLKCYFSVHLIIQFVHPNKVNSSRAI